MKSKKGIEWPRTLMYTLFSMFLFILGAVLILSLIQNFIATAEIADDNVRYTLLSYRLIGSENCLAYGDNFGLVDFSKFDRNRVSNCLEGADFELELEFDGTRTSISKGSPSVIEDYFFVKVKKGQEIGDGVLGIKL